MILAVASGKGGTGKTTVAVSLALSLLEESDPPVLVDCDVEAANAGLFLQVDLDEQKPVSLLIPEVDFAKCTYCGRCAEVCRYHAITVFGEKVMVFPQLCHGCGSCSLNCPEGAIREVPVQVGIIEHGQANGMPFGQGRLDIGSVMSVPIIKQLKNWMLEDADPQQTVILDAPPGSTCPVVETMRGVDYVLMVTEPTPYGLHDLRLAAEVARDELGLPVGVVINRDGVGDDGVDQYCREQGIPILLRIPQDRRIAEAYSRGEPLIQALPAYRLRMRAMYAAIQRQMASSEAVSVVGRGA